MGWYAYITEIDLASGYWNIWITKEDRYKTAFQLPDGRVYQWTRFPFGLDISGSVFCMIIMTKCIPRHLHKRALAYSDNIYVYTKEMDLSAHLRDVALVLADLEKNGITAKPSKSFFAMQSCVRELELRRSWQPNRNFVFNLRPSRRDEGHVLSKYSGKPKRSFSAQLLML